MKYFIRHTALYVLIFSIVLVVFEIASSALINKNADFRLQGKPQYLVLGHSHPECAFNDSLIDGLYNISQSGETYFYTYHKTKKLLEQNESIHTVFIEYTNNQITKEMDSWTWGDEYISYRYPSYSPFLSGKEKLLLFGYNPRAVLNSFSVSALKRFNQMFSHDYDYGKRLGGFLFLDRTYTADGLDDANRNNDSINTAYEQAGISELNIAYLDKLLELCARHGKRTILIRSPLHRSYSGFQNEVDFQKILTARYSGIEFLDFSKFPLDDHEFADLEHLNYKGARVFSLWFQELLAQGLLSRDNKQRFIESQYSPPNYSSNP